MRSHTSPETGAAANDLPQITTEEFPIESRHESEIDLEEGQAIHAVSSQVEQLRVWRRKIELVEGVLKRQDMQRSRYVFKSITALKRTRWLQSTVMLSSTPMASQQLERLELQLNTPGARKCYRVSIKVSSTSVVWLRTETINSVAGGKVSSIWDTDEDRGRVDTTEVVVQTQWMDLEQFRRENRRQNWILKS